MFYKGQDEKQNHKQYVPRYNHLENKKTSRKGDVDTPYRTERMGAAVNLPNRDFFSTNLCTSQQHSDEPEEENCLSRWDVLFRELLCKTPRVESVWEGMATLGDHFKAAAITNAQMIIGEQHVHEMHKKISPIDVGGIAGGTKFQVHGLFFKYPVDSKIDEDNWLYGGVDKNNTLAAKANNHDLNGLVHCFAADTDHDFNFPLQSQILHTN